MSDFLVTIGELIMYKMKNALKDVLLGKISSFEQVDFPPPGVSFLPLYMCFRSFLVNCLSWIP